MRIKVIALFVVIAVSAIFSDGAAALDADTLYVSDRYTTHIIFSTDISYANLSDQVNLAGKVVEQAKNKIAVKARGPFTSPASISAEEANGRFHTYILCYSDEPEYLVYDERVDGDRDSFSSLDTLYLSQAFTSHVIFATDINYADLSNPKLVSAKIVEQGKNKLALKARMPFTGTASVSVEEANGVFHTYYIAFRENPETLVKDTRVKAASADSEAVGGSRGQYANYLKKGDAPLLSEIILLPQQLYHLSKKQYSVRFTVENIFSYSDITYITIALDNESQISYESSDATFVIESKKNSKRKVFYETNIYPKNRFGTLTAAPGEKTRIVYSFDKMTLSGEQVLKIYLYEKDGQRNTEITLSYQDVNRAISPYGRM